MTTILLMNMLVVCPFAYGEIYRWVDEKGKVHYGDAPHGTNARKVQIKPPPASVTDPKERSSREALKKFEAGLLRGYAQRKALEKEKQARRAEQKAEQAKKCAKAQADYERFAKYDGLRRYDLDQDGNKVYLNAAEIDHRESKYANWLDKNCP